MSDEQKTALNRMVLQSLESLQAAGVLQLAKPQAGGEAVCEPTAVVAAEAPLESAAAGVEVETQQPSLEAAPIAAKSVAPTLEVLRSEVAACTQCEELASARTQTVFGVGNPEARLCFLGEAPGADEDRLGEPFVGRGGQLLNKILEACKLRREDVYILNTIKCRPPNNRNPKEDEARNCRHFLERQLELIEPEFICCLGAVAAQNLLSTTTAIGRLRGQVHDYQGIKVVCTYHPAYLLRNPSAKKYTWDDMKMLMSEMGTPVG